MPLSSVVSEPTTAALEVFSFLRAKRPPWAALYLCHCVKGEPARPENSQRGDQDRLEVFLKFPFQSGDITLIKPSVSFNKVLIKP